MQGAELKRSSARNAREKKLDLLLAISLCSFVFSAAYYYWRGVYRLESWPFNTSLYRPADRFNDFDNMLQICRDLARASEESWYLPAANLYFHLFSLIPGKLSLCLFLLMPTLGLIWYAARTLNGFSIPRKISYLVGIFLISHPFLIGVDRGNLDLHLFLCLTLFVVFYEKPTRRPHEQFLAALGLGLAGAFKIFPLLFGVVYLKDRRFKELGLTGLIFVGVTALTAQLQGGFFQSGLALFRHFGEADDIEVRVGARFNLGIFNAGRFFLDAFKLPDAMHIFEAWYLPLSGVLLIVICALALRRSLELWRCLTALACAMCFLPVWSNDYRLLTLLLPLCLFIREQSEMTKRDYGICVLFGLLLIPKGHLIIYYIADVGASEAGLATPATFLNPLLLVCLTIMVLLPTGARSLAAATAANRNPPK